MPWSCSSQKAYKKAAQSGINRDMAALELGVNREVGFQARDNMVQMVGIFEQCLPDWGSRGGGVSFT